MATLVIVRNLVDFVTDDIKKRGAVKMRPLLCRLIE